MELSVEDLIRDVDVDIAQGKHVRDAVLTLRDRLHAVLETLVDSEIDIAKIMQPRKVDDAELG